MMASAVARHQDRRLSLTDLEAAITMREEFERDFEWSVHPCHSPRLYQPVAIRYQLYPIFNFVADVSSSYMRKHKACLQHFLMTGHESNNLG